MGNKLIIAEKPMLARDIASAICGKSGKLPIRGNGYVICACAGHLLELKEPEQIDKKWKQPWTLESLPINPRPWKKKISRGKKELVDTIAKELKACDSVIHAGDPDDEGQLIVDEVLDYLGYKGKVERVYVNDSIEKNIKRAFQKLENNDNCRGDGAGALSRQYADFTFGANESRLACLKCGQNLSVGRVQTPTLGLVVNRDRAIKNHIVQKFYELFVDAGIKNSNTSVSFKFNPEKDLYETGEKHIFDKSVLENVKQFIPDVFVADTKITEEKKAAPLPYNLTKLQSACSKLFGYSAKQTLDITQALRDKYKAITYNRTDCQYLSSEHYKQAQDVSSIVSKNLNIRIDSLDFGLKHKAFNDKNISAHHAIIPQEIKVDLNKLSESEKNVYKLICESYLRLFLPPQVFSVSTTQYDIFDNDSKKLGTIKYVAKKVIDPGWTKFGSKSDKSEDEKRAFIDAGKHEYDVLNRRIIEKETNPPKPYTEGTLIADMASIAKYCKDKEIKEILQKKDEDKKGEHGGIGTTATRGNIIESLKKRGLLTTKGKQIISTEKGQTFYDLIPDNIKSADLTAKWWLMQEQVAEGKLGEYCVADNVIQVFNEHKETAYRDAAFNKADKTKVATCPICGEAIIATGKIYQCSSNKSEKDASGNWKEVAGCGFKMFPKICGKKLSPTQFRNICAGDTVYVKGLKSKAGKKFECYVRLNDKPKNGFYGVDFVFDKKVK